MLTQKVSLQEDPGFTEETISSISLFGALNPNQIQGLLPLMQVRLCRSGEHIFSAGDLPSDIYVLLSGRVDLVVNQGGVHRIRDSFGFGDTFGETAVIGIQPQIGNAIAFADDVKLLVISREALIELQERDVEVFAILMMNIARAVSRKLHAC